MNTFDIQGFGDRVHKQLIGLGYVKRDKPDVSRFCRERDYRPQYVYAWLKGRLPRAGYLERLAGDLQVSPAWLMFGEQSAQMAEVRASMAWGAGAAPAPLRPQPPRAVPSGGRSAHAARATPPLGPRLIDFRRLRELTQQLSQVEAQLEGVFRAFPDRYLWLDPDGKVLSCNGPDEDGSIVGKGLLEVFPPEAGQLLHDALHRARQTGDLATIEYAVREAADERVYEARFVPLGDPATTRLQVLLFVRDLTERKRLEARLRDRDRAYVSLLCNLSSMAYRRRNDERWTMALVSDGCLALTGHAAPELSGNRVVAFAALIHPEDRQRVSEKCQASLEARVPCSSEYRIVTAAGEEKWVWDQAQGVYGPSGEILAVEGLVTDITQRKRAEEIAAALGDVGREMAGTLDFAEATEAMVTAVLRLFRVRRAVLWRLDPETGLLRRVAAAGEGYAGDWIGNTLEVGQGPAGKAVADRYPVASANVLTDPALFLAEWQRHDRSTLAVPLSAHDRVLGALVLWDRPGREFSSQETRLLSAFADRAALALQNAELYQAARDLADRLQTVNRLNRLVSSTLDQDEVLRAISQAAADLMEVPLAVFFLPDEAAMTLSAHAASEGPPAADLPVPVLAFGQNAAGWVAVHRAPLHIADVFADGRITHPEWWRAHGLASLLALPILRGDALLGVLALCSPQPFRLDAGDQQLLDSLLAQAAEAIRNARLFARSESARQAAEALWEIERLLSQTWDPEVVAQRITDSVRALFSAQSSAIYRLDADAGHLVGLAGSGEMGPAFRPGIVMPRGAGAVGRAVATGEPVATPNVLADKRITLPAEIRARIEQAPCRAVLALPLVIHEEVIGALSVADTEGRRFGPEDIHLAQAFAAQAALALENARLHREATAHRG